MDSTKQIFKQASQAFRLGFFSAEEAFLSAATQQLLLRVILVLIVTLHIIKYVDVDGCKEVLTFVHT